MKLKLCTVYYKIMWFWQDRSYNETHKKCFDELILRGLAATILKVDKLEKIYKKQFF